MVLIKNSSSSKKPHVQRALTLRSGGASWKDASAAVDMDYRTLRRYVRAHPDSLQFLEEQTKDQLDQSHSVLIANAPSVLGALGRRFESCRPDLDLTKWKN
mgnify:CR=1 FL=1